jgi:hypothetical protein
MWLLLISNKCVFCCFSYDFGNKRVSSFPCLLLNFQIYWGSADIEDGGGEGGTVDLLVLRGVSLKTVRFWVLSLSLGALCWMELSKFIAPWHLFPTMLYGQLGPCSAQALGSPVGFLSIASQMPMLTTAMYLS